MGTTSSLPDLLLPQLRWDEQCVFLALVKVYLLLSRAYWPDGTLKNGPLVQGKAFNRIIQIWLENSTLRFAREGIA